MGAVLIACTALTLKHFFACDSQRDFGDHSDGETPVPIPNTAVKPVSADGTGLATVWESRSSPRSLFYAWKGRDRFLPAQSECMRMRAGWLRPSLNWLLLFAPVSLLAELSHQPLVVFVSSGLAIIPLAGLDGPVNAQ